MNHRQENFARLVAAGRAQADAYREAYPRSRNWKDGTARKRASELMKRRDVARKVAELRAAAETAATMDCNQARVILSERVERIVAENGPTMELCRAVDSLARISGWLSPAAIAVSVSPADTPTPEERARRIREALGVPDGEEGGGHA